jgi:hypothetical protein
MSTLLFFVIATMIAVFLAGILFVFRTQRDKRKIRNALRKENLKNMAVDFIFTWDRIVYVYDVYYEDEAGRFYTKKCRVYPWDSSVYWVSEDSL